MSRPKAPVKMYDGFAKGMIVRKYIRWGDNAGKPDMDGLYLIRAIGPMGATVDRLDSTTNLKVPYRRGRRELLYTQQEAERYINGGSMRRNVWDYPYQWSQVFIQVGQEGWDPDF